MSDRYARCHIVFCRVPGVEPIKTRLAAAIGITAATEIYSACLLDTLGAAILSGAGRVIVCFRPTSAEAVLQDWLHSHNLYPELWPQPDGDLGDRMAVAFRRAFAEGLEEVAILGSDSPGISASQLNTCFDVLTEQDVVFGPALDGGFYLVGSRISADNKEMGGACLDSLFAGVSWSQPDTLLQVLQRAACAGISTGLLQWWPDIDSIDDMAFALQMLRTLRAAGEYRGQRALVVLEGMIGSVLEK